MSRMVYFLKGPPFVAPFKENKILAPRSGNEGEIPKYKYTSYKLTRILYFTHDHIKYYTRFFTTFLSL